MGFILNPGTGLAGNGTKAQAHQLMDSFLMELNFHPLHVDYFCETLPLDRDYPLTGYYDYGLSLDEHRRDEHVHVMMPGVDLERVICGDDYNPFTICRVYVDHESLPWPGAVHVAREALKKMQDQEGDRHWLG